MRALTSRIPSLFTRRDGTLPIAAGLALLAAAMLDPGIPAVTAMALITLGATDAMMARFCRSRGVFLLMMPHVMIYGGLYSLFVGAALNTTRVAPTLVAVDLAASIALIAIALVRACRTLHGELAAD